MFPRVAYGVRPAIAVVLMLAACSSSKPQQTAPESVAPPPSSQVPIGQLPSIDPVSLLASTKILSSDEYEGRAPGSRGEQLTVGYITSQFQKLGLKPGNPDGTYVQKVPLVGITADPDTSLVLKKGAQRHQLAYRDDVVAWTKHVEPTASIDNSELVFVGYGVVAPEYEWDDYKGIETKGKTLVMLVGDPPVADPSDPSKLDPKVFGGTAMTYYGRWTYKYEIGAQKGAAGVLIVHETGPAGYAWDVVQGMGGERFDLIMQDKNLGRAAIEGWITVDQARAMMKMAGQDYDASKAAAATREFKPTPLGVTASMTLHNKLRTIDSQNVIGKLEGSDPALKDEYVIYTAHWDHFGHTPEGIFHGAEDNALGVAGLIDVARAFTRLPTPPKRSVLFLSVTAEEQGLLGSEYYTRNPLYPLAKTLASINIDAANVHGRTRDLTIIGLGASTLDDYASAAAAEQGRVIRPDPEPEKGFYYRSDHFNFAKQGVPALNPEAGIDYLGKPAEYGRDARDDYNAHRYHKPADVVLPNWDLSGEREDLELLLAVGYRVAQADRFPTWKPGSEFKAKREEMLKH
jgi:Zn-dependent M28 family amino/carboxypeptidase